MGDGAFSRYYRDYILMISSVYERFITAALAGTPTDVCKEIAAYLLPSKTWLAKTIFGYDARNPIYFTTNLEGRKDTLFVQIDNNVITRQNILLADLDSLSCLHIEDAPSDWREAYILRFRTRLINHLTERIYDYTHQPIEVPIYHLITYIHSD